MVPMASFWLYSLDNWKPYRLKPSTSAVLPSISTVGDSFQAWKQSLDVSPFSINSFVVIRFFNTTHLSTLHHWVHIKESEYLTQQLGWTSVSPAYSYSGVSPWMPWSLLGRLSTLRKKGSFPGTWKNVLLRILAQWNHLYSMRKMTQSNHLQPIISVME